MEGRGVGVVPVVSTLQDRKKNTSGTKTPFKSLILLKACTSSVFRPQGNQGLTRGGGIKKDAFKRKKDAKWFRAERKGFRSERIGFLDGGGRPGALATSRLENPTLQA